MAVQVKVPVLSESIADGVLMDWHCKPGDYVKRDQLLVELETDKVILEISAPAAGVITAIEKPVGSRVGSEQIIAVIDDAATTPVTTEAVAPSAATRPVAEATSGARLSPAVRSMVAEHNLDPDHIAATGKDGRITKTDVLKHMEHKTADAAPVVAATNVNVSTAGRHDRRVAMTRLRARIAERLKEAQNTAAILTTFNEVNMQPVQELRERYQTQFQQKYGIKIGFMSFFVKAVVEALRQYPVINASVDGNDIVYHDYYDIGVAVSSPRGLVVPILRDADALGFADIERQIADLGVKAKEGKLTMEDLTGGTFSISNGGVFGSMLSTPILNPPQSAILGMHAIQPRAVVENGAVVARPMMYLALSYDHRIIDGHEAVLFLKTVKGALEDPARMLLGV